MIIKGADFNNKEKAVFALRALYSSSGFEMFRMSKFEEYSLYARNRDFMECESIITFTDTDGKLMALKPDVTLSIVKNNRHIGDRIIKLYYNENVYRVSARTRYFKEIMQVGLECLGQIDRECICEVLMLAARSMELLSEGAVLDISNLDILSRLMQECNLPAEGIAEVARCISAKNLHGLTRVCSSYRVDEDKTELLKTLIDTYGSPDKVIPKLEKTFAETENADGYMESINLLKTVTEPFKGTEFENMIKIDFSVVSDLKYYNGIVFKGFARGIPDGVLSGGQYDRLMRNMNRNSKAIGFGVYLDALGSLSKFDGEEVEIYG